MRKPTKRQQTKPTKSRILRPASKTSKRDWWRQASERWEAEVAEVAVEAASYAKVPRSDVPTKPAVRRPGRPPRQIILTPGIAAKEQQARRNHQRLPDLPADATPAARLARRRRGGRPPGVRMSLETRIRRAYAANRTYLVLNGTDVLELHALYNIINPAGDLFRNENAYRGGGRNSNIQCLTLGDASRRCSDPACPRCGRGMQRFDFDGQINARWLRMTLGQLMIRAAAAAAEEEDATGKR